MSDAGFNRLTLMFALFGWLVWSVDLFLAPRTWWTVLIMSLTIGVLAGFAESISRNTGG